MERMKHPHDTHTHKHTHSNARIHIYYGDAKIVCFTIFRMPNNAWPTAHFIIPCYNSRKMPFGSHDEKKRRKKQLPKTRERARREKNHKFSRAKAIFGIQVTPNIAMSFEISMERVSLFTRTIRRPVHTTSDLLIFFPLLWVHNTLKVTIVSNSIMAYCGLMDWWIFG